MGGDTQGTMLWGWGRVWGSLGLGVPVPTLAVPQSQPWHCLWSPGDTQDVPPSPWQGLEQWEFQGCVLFPVLFPPGNLPRVLDLLAPPGIPFSSTAWCCCDQGTPTGGGLLKVLFLFFRSFSHQSSAAVGWWPVERCRSPSPSGGEDIPVPFPPSQGCIPPRFWAAAPGADPGTDPGPASPELRVSGVALGCLVVSGAVFRDTLTHLGMVYAPLVQFLSITHPGHGCCLQLWHPQAPNL